MRIFDIDNNEIQNPDLELGYLLEEKIFISHHSAVEAVPEQWHYETIQVYPNGGKDVKKVIDAPGVEAKEAWDEYETIQRYMLYTEEELEEIKNQKNEPTIEERITELEAQNKILEAQNEMLLQCVLEMSEAVYA